MGGLRWVYVGKEEMIGRCVFVFCVCACVCVCVYVEEDGELKQQRKKKKMKRRTSRAIWSHACVSFFFFSCVCTQTTCLLPLFTFLTYTLPTYMHSLFSEPPCM